MTNQERWLEYNKHLFADELYISVGWYFCVAAALERRVWVGRLDDKPLFPNLYVLLVGEAASGKSQVLSSIKNIITHPQMEKPDTVDQATWDRTADSAGGHPLFNIGADATSYESLVHDLAEGTKSLEIIVDGDPRVYFHASQVFILSELKSLLKMHTKVGPERKIGDFLLQTYDGESYRYKLKHQPEDVIRNSCVSVAAGAVPKTIHEAARANIFEDGLASRFIFVMPEEGTDPGDFFLEKTSDKQMAHLGALRDRVIYLSTTSGELSIDNEAKEYMTEWWRTVHVKDLERAGPNFASYLRRRRVAILKMAMAVHFSDKDDMVITLDDFTTAIQILKPIEAAMRKAFTNFGKNEQMPYVQEILKTLTSLGSMHAIELFDMHKGNLTYGELQTILDELLETGQVKLTNSGSYKLVERNKA